LVKNLLIVMNEKSTNSNKIFIELATEFLDSLIDNASNLVSLSCQTFINDFFDQPVK
jgi:hypothetical protein